jgi:hypothetical protein
MLLAFLMIPLLQRELDIFKESVWNTHRIRAQKNTNLPDGVPNHIYSFPELYELEDKGAFHINKFYVLLLIPVVSLHSVHVILVYFLFIMQHLVRPSLFFGLRKNIDACLHVYSVLIYIFTLIELNI